MLPGRPVECGHVLRLSVASTLSQIGKGDVVAFHIVALPLAPGDGDGRWRLGGRGQVDRSRYGQSCMCVCVRGGGGNSACITVEFMMVLFKNEKFFGELTRFLLKCLEVSC